MICFARATAFQSLGRNPELPFIVLATKVDIQVRRSNGRCWPEAEVQVRITEEPKPTFIFDQRSAPVDPTRFRLSRNINVRH